MPVISLDVHVDDLDSVLAIFDKIQVWRSVDELGAPTPYAEITAALETKATLDGTVQGPWNLSGTNLVITLNSADPITITFTGSDPLNLPAVAQAINSMIPTLAKEIPTDTGMLRLESPVLGTGSSIQVSGGAATILGLPTTKTNGRAARLGLTNPTTDYLFRDFDGTNVLWYKTRYFSSLTGAVSSFSDPRQGNPEVVLDAGLLSKAVVYLADGAGRPIVNRRVIFVPITNKTVTSGGLLYGSLPGVDRLVMSTDEKGNAEINLLRGQTFRVFFEGTSYQREFVVPDVSQFDLLTVLSTAADPFSIYQAPPSPIREA